MNRHLLWPTAGTGADLATTLLHAAQDGTNRLSGSPADIIKGYLDWVSSQVRMLQTRVAPADLDQLLTTPRYWATVANQIPSPSTVSAVLEEIQYRARLMALAATVLNDAAEAWRPVDGAYSNLALVDTNFWVEQRESFDNIDWHELLERADGPSAPAMQDELRIVVPMVVIDELEKQKRSSDKRLRGRAQVTLAVIERVARDNVAGRLREADFSGIDRGEIPSGETWLDVLFDLPGHVRLPINDDEIVDRALSVQILSGKDVTFLTYDTNQALCARHAGLNNVMHLKHQRATEPN